MNEQTSNFNEAFMEVISGKMALQDKKITSLEEEIKNSPDSKELMQKLINTIEGLQDEVKNSRFPTEKLSSFAAWMDVAISQLKQPVEKKVVHHHHIPKVILISAGLFIVLAITCSGWYMTASKLDNYIANDTKYRQLRLDTAQRSLQHYLYMTDSFYYANTDMRKVVLEAEEENQKNFERLQKAERLKNEAQNLEKAAKREISNNKKLYKIFY